MPERGGGRVRIDHAIDRLLLVYRHARLPAIRPAPDGITRTLADIAVAIRPLRLPAEVETFWRRVDPASMALAPVPEPIRAAFALEAWQVHEGQPGLVPRPLFPFCCTGDAFLLVELDDGAGHGGACFRWGYGEGDFRLTHADLGGYLDQLATMIELGEYEARENPGGGVQHRFDPEQRWDDTAAVRLTAALPLATYGAQREFDADPRRWPAHWRALSGLPDSGPRGATTTIADLVAAADGRDEVRGTVRAQVVHLALVLDGSRAEISDGTGTLDLWCPNAATAYGPVIGRVFEFDVLVRGRPTAPPDVDDLHREATRRALSGDMAGAQEAVAGMYARRFGTPAAAEATAIRPLD
jgi:hypothetical protein